ncbi:glycosyltransferase family 4 protein [Halovenus sp. HT40]|uniref:glycosyltransferase family 4 protein n=1 Tax=Halovenus sp. HT40 TaxID=3126691 RepID=UPI00300EC8B9
MNVLLISLDDSVLESEGPGDTRERHLLYADTLSRFKDGSTIHSVVLSKNRDLDRRYELNENLVVYPTRSRHRLLFPKDAFRTGNKICNNNRIDLIVSQTPFDDGLVGLLLGELYDIPYFAELRPSNLDDPKWLKEQYKNRIKRKVGKKILPLADAIRVTNTTGRSYCVDKLGLEKDKIHLNYTPVSELIDNNDINIDDQTDNMTILFIGRLVELKNVHNLIETVAMLQDTIPNIELVIVGDGPERQQLESHSQELGIEDMITFTGVVDYDQIGQYYRSATITVLPSKRETFGRVIIESFYYATPVVATRTRGALEIINDGETGILLDEDSPQAIAESLSKLYNDKNKIINMGKQAKKFVSNQYNPETLAEELVSAWLTVGYASNERCDINK